MKYLIAKIQQSEKDMEIQREVQDQGCSTLSYLEGVRVHGHITYSELNGALKIIISRPEPICRPHLYCSEWTSLPS
jgi:hypothetical protein